MKKIALSLILILVTLTSAYAARKTYKGKCGDNIKWELATKTGVLTISGTGRMYDYSFENKSPWSERNVKIQNVIINEGVTHIGEYAFYSHFYVTSVSIPEGVVSIGDHAFSGCFNLQSIVIPNSTLSIGRWAFQTCIKITSIVIPQNVEIIGDYAFHGCTAMKSVIIPKSVVKIGQRVFTFCNSLETISVDALNPNYCDIDGVLYLKAKTVLLYYPTGKKASSYTVPLSVWKIEDGAFLHNKYIKEVVLPDGLNEIESFTFDGCTSLSSIVIPNSVTKIGAYAFNKCTSLSSIDIPKSVTKIGDYAFWGCSSLTDLIYPSGLDISASKVPSSTSCIPYTQDPDYLRIILMR